MRLASGILKSHKIPWITSHLLLNFSFYPLFEPFAARLVTAVHPCPPTRDQKHYKGFNPMNSVPINIKKIFNFFSQMVQLYSCVWVAITRTLAIDVCIFLVFHLKWLYTRASMPPLLFLFFTLPFSAEVRLIALKNLLFHAVFLLYDVVYVNWKILAKKNASLWLKLLSSSSS